MKLSKDEVNKIVNKLKKDTDVKVYTPWKYFKGLKTKKEVESRFKDIVKGAKNPGKGYNPFKTDLTPGGK